MADQLNQNNFLRWNGEFNNLPFTIVATDDAASAAVNAISIDLSPLANDVSSIGFDYKSLIITEQDNEDNPATWNWETHILTYFLPTGATPGVHELKYMFSDVNGNQSNEATITITLTARATAWRGYGPSYSCELDGGGLKTGYGKYATLQKYYTDDLLPVMPLATKPNTSGDPDFIPHALDPNCNNDTFKVWSLASSGGFAGLVSCSNFDDGISVSNYYTIPSVTALAIGVTLYQDSALTTPVTDLPNRYSNGDRYYETSSGIIVHIFSCSLTS